MALLVNKMETGTLKWEIWLSNEVAFLYQVVNFHWCLCGQCVILQGRVSDSHSRQGWELQPTFLSSACCQECFLGIPAASPWKKSLTAPFMLGDSEQTSPSVFLYLSCRHRYINTSLLCLVWGESQALNPAELGLLTYIPLVPLPCQIYGVLWAASFCLRKEKRLKLFVVCWEFSCKSPPRSGKWCTCCPHAMTTHGWHNGPGSWCSVSLQISWRLPWLPECWVGSWGSTDGQLNKHTPSKQGAARCRCRPGDGAARILQDSTEMGGEILSSYLWAVFPNESHVSQLHRSTESSTILMMPQAPVFGSWTAPVSSTSQFTNLSFSDLFTTFLNAYLIYCSVFSVLNLSVPAQGVPE